MRGVLEYEGTRYCIVQQRSVLSGEYWPGGPSFEAPTDRQGRMVAGGQPVQGINVVAVDEADVWEHNKELVTISGWPVYPFSESLCQLLPLPLVDRLRTRTRVQITSPRGDATVEIDWGGVLLTQQFQVLNIEAGLAVWPERALSSWTSYHFLCAPGKVQQADRN